VVHQRTAYPGSEPGHYVIGSGVHEGRRQTARREELAVVQEGPSDIPALKPYWGKPAVRNFRGDHGDVGIMRSPVRAMVLPGSGSGCNSPGRLGVGRNPNPYSDCRHVIVFLFGGGVKSMGLGIPLFPWFSDPWTRAWRRGSGA
jgi:hypothetical protein